MRDRKGPVRKISVASPVIGETEKRYVADCLDSSWISSIGKYLSRFEEAFAEFCEVKHAITTNNGTTAIHLALVTLGIGPGDEVIVPTLTFVATANAVRYCGATPVLVDCDEETLNIDVRAIESKITARTRALIPVHLYGHPADMDPILELAKKYNFHVIEDAAEAHGAKYRGRTVGSIGTCASFSFYGNKIVTTGEGGMVTTDDDELAAKLRLYRGQGMDPNRFAEWNEKYFPRSDAVNAPAQPTRPGQSTSGVQSISSAADYAKLAPGAQYRDPQGNVRTKPRAQ